ncbi:hypothetical protein FISHEDRAFT_64979 [Fistulina hepatica ATCC 64428]|uniref:GH16 domain-containing protein n=1 Tax=Fistulina hepatica ATCC 64428 TaxID=1128425 RepID=A0A0D7AGF5_9AGAR|nr:hypothetical protein FISHEDRAFT_64979 [Fistulina hepatica ATCC 64428]
MRSGFLIALVVCAAEVLAAYNLVKEFSGDTFFDDWTYYGYWDNLTSGDVEFLSRANATADKLTYVNDAGRAIIKVDNTTDVLYNYKRNSVRISSNDSYPVGAIIVFDAYHIPYGCSVWPSFWTKGPDWPDYGEIDIIEAVNLMNYNQYALHALDGCNKATSVNQTGTTTSTNCTAASGCVVEETKSNSYGSGFASAGGGVFVTQFDISGIYLWFWTRSDIPSSITNATDSIDISDWGTPSAAYPNTSCIIDKYFGDQTLIIDITLCGTCFLTICRAGVASIYNETCTGLCYQDNVIGNGSNYDTAYFEISYIKVYGTGSAYASSTASASASATSTKSSSLSSSTSLSENIAWISIPVELFMNVMYSCQNVGHAFSTHFI